MTIEREVGDVRRENDYLKLRNAQLQRDVIALEAEGLRLRQELERRGGGAQRTQPLVRPIWSRDTP
jgi:hypothetical protein